MTIEDELLPHNVSRMWSRFEAAMQERDMTLQAEVIRYMQDFFLSLHCCCVLFSITFMFLLEPCCFVSLLVLEINQKH